MTNALDTYLHQIGLVTDRGPMLLPISHSSGDAAARDDRPTVSSGQLQQQQQQQQQPTTISSTKDVSLPPPSVAKFRSAADGNLIYTNPVIEGSSVSGPLDLGPISVTVTTANYPSIGEPTYVHSTNTPASWSKASDSSSRSFLFGDAVVNRHPNAVTTVTVSNTPSDLDTKSSHQNNNVTQVSHVTSKLSSPPNTRQTVVQCSSNSYTLSHNVSQVTSQTSGIPTISYPVMQSVHAYPNSLATAHSVAISNSLNFKDFTQPTHIYDRSCLVDVDRLSYESPGVSGSDLSRDNNSLVISIRQNLSDILQLNQTPFDQSQLNQQNQSTIFNRAPTFDDHCSGIQPNGNRHFPADDSKRKERQDIVLSPSTLSSTGSSTPPLSQSSNVVVENQPTVIKSSLKKETPPNGVRKAVTFCAADLVHVEEYTLSPATPPHDLFLPLDQQLENISEDTESVLFGVDSAELWPPGTHENYQGSWFNSSTDTEPYIFDFPSPTDESRDCAPLSFANDVFGRTTIVLTSGTFRPGESGKLNGKTVSDLNGSHDHRRTLSTGTLSGLRSHRTLVKVNFIQGLLDINHNPGQTAEADSKAVQDNGSGTGIVSTLNYCRGIFHENLKNPSMKEFPNQQISAQKRVDQKICHKLSRYKHKLIAAIVGVFILLSLAIGLGVGLNRK